MSLFNELKASLEEAVAIQQPRQPATLVTRFEVADVKAIRAALNVSQQEMADALGTSVDTLQSRESRHRNPTALAAKSSHVDTLNSQESRRHNPTALAAKVLATLADTSIDVAVLLPSSSAALARAATSWPSNCCPKGFRRKPCTAISPKQHGRRCCRHFATAPCRRWWPPMSPPAA